MNNKKIIPLFTLLILFIIVKLPIFLLGYIHNYQLQFDDLDYFYIAHKSGFFLVLARPIIYPLFIKLLNYNFDTIFIVQFLFSAFAWAKFAECLLQFTREKKVKWFLVAITLIIAGSIYITNWDNKILTESLSISSLVIMMSEIFKPQMTKRNLIVFMLNTMIFIGLRDSHYLIIPAFLLLLLFKPIGLTKKIISCTLIVCAMVFMMVTAHLGERQTINLADILNYRILAIDEHYQWYVQHTDFPAVKKEFDQCNQKNPYFCVPRSQLLFLSPRLIERSHWNQTYVDHYPYLKQLKQYIDNSLTLKTDYLRFLMHHPGIILFDHGTNFTLYSEGGIKLLSGEAYPSYGGINKLISFPHVIQWSNIMYCCTTTIVLLINIILLKQKNGRHILLFFSIILLTLLFDWINFISEPMEVSRHVLIGNLVLILCLLIGISHSNRKKKSLAKTIGLTS